MRRWPAVLVAAPVLLLAPAPAAVAGGWWSSLDLGDHHLAPGDRVRVGTGFAFRTTEAAERARSGGDFRVYLVRGFDWDRLEEAMRVANPGSWWELGSARAFEVGRVRLSGFDLNLARARASFVVPPLRPGAYALMFCDAGCSRPVGDIVPSRVLVAPDRFTAHLARRVDELGLELREARRRLRAARDRILELEAVADDGPRALLAARVDRLSALVRDLERRPVGAEGGSGASGGVWLGALAAAAAALALGWAIGRRGRRDLPPVPDDPRSLDHERERTLAGRR